MYEQLIFIFNHLQTSCEPLWPQSFHPWSAIFLADYVRGIISEADFIRWFSMANSDYIALGECITDVVNPKT